MAIAAAFFVLLLRTPVTKVDGEGISSKAFIRRRSWSWDEVAAIDVTPNLGYRCVDLRLRNGATKRLQVPTDGFMLRDPEFDEKVRQLRERMASASGRTAPSKSSMLPNAIAPF